MLRVGLSLIVAVGLWASRLPAQAPIPIPPPIQIPPPIVQKAPMAPGYLTPYPPHVLVVPYVPYEPAHHPYSDAALVPPLQPPPGKHCLQRMFNSHGMGCQANPDGTGNLHSEFRFVFGSSRWFFGESCWPNLGHHHGKYAR